MLHPLGFVEGYFDKFLNSNEGPEGCSIYSHEFYETKKIEILKEVIRFNF